MLITKTNFACIEPINPQGGWTTTQSSLFNDIPTSFITAGSQIFVATTRSGILASADGDQTWRDSSTGLNTSRVITLAQTGTTLLAGIDQGVYRSLDQGKT